MPFIEQRVRELVVAHAKENMLTPAQIGKKYGISENAVRRIAKHAKIGRQGSKVKESPEVLAVGAWVYDRQGGLVGRWDPTAHPEQPQQEVQ